MAQDYHEDVTLLDDHAKDMVRALCSLKEEIEAVDWYHQRVVACTDEALKNIMAHNRDEEIEHAMMTLEWLRRNGSPAWDAHMRTFLFKEGEIAHGEHGGDGDHGSQVEQEAKGLGIGKL